MRPVALSTSFLISPKRVTGAGLSGVVGRIAAGQKSSLRGMGVVLAKRNWVWMELKLSP